jgi:putative ABC transport system permease protein
LTMLGKMITRSLLKNARLSAWMLLTLTTCAALVTVFTTVAFEVGATMSRALRRVGANAVAYEAPDWARFEDEARRQGVDVVRVSGRVGLIEGSPVAVMAAEPHALQRLTPYWAITGRRAIGSHNCLVGKRVADTFHLQPGSTVTVQWPDQQPVTRCTVAGIAETGDEDDARVFTAGGLANSHVTYALLSAPDGESQMRVLQQLTGAKIQPLRQIVHGERQILETIDVLFLCTLAVVLLLTALGVSASMWARVVERRKEFALLQALGAGRVKVVTFLVAESATVGAVAAVLGFALGSGMAIGVVRQVFQATMTPHWSSVPITLVTTVGVAVLAGAVACARTLRFQPAAALRGE